MVGVLVAALALVVVAGCGKSGGGGVGGGRLSKSEYQKQVQAEGKKIRDAFQSLTPQNATDFKALAKSVRKGQTELNKAADQLGKINPPSDIEGPHRDLVAAMHELADELGPFADALETADTKKINAASQKISKSAAVKKAQKAVADIKKKGYDLGVIGQN